MANDQEQEYEPSEQRQFLAEHITEEDVQKLLDAKKQGKDAIRTQLAMLRESFRAKKGA